MKRRKQWGATLETVSPLSKQTYYQQLEHDWFDLIENHAKCRHCGMVRRREMVEYNPTRRINRAPNMPFWIAERTTINHYAIELPDGSIKEYEADLYVFTIEPLCKQVLVPPNTRRK